MQQLSDLHLQFALTPQHVRSIADIQSAAAEIRQEKKERRKNKPQHENIMVCPIPQGDHKKVTEGYR